MNDILLYIAPGSCSRVPLISLLEAKADFETSTVRFMKGEHKSPAYKKLNPKGKVPALVVDGEALTENVAILSFLHQLFPAAQLLPPAATPLDAARQIADLCFCSATLHPIVTRIRVPAFFAAPEATRTVWQKGCEAMREYFQLVEDRLADGPWWYGADWSVLAGRRRQFSGRRISALCRSRAAHGDAAVIPARDGDRGGRHRRAGS